MNTFFTVIGPTAPNGGRKVKVEPAAVWVSVESKPRIT